MSNLIKWDQSIEPVPRQPHLDPWLLPEGPGQPGFDLRRYIAVFLKRKWTILALSLTVAAGFTIHTLTLTPLYMSTAQIQINPEETDFLPFKDVLDQARFDYAYLATQNNVLKSDTMARRVVRKLELAKNIAFTSPPPDGFMNRLKDWGGAVPAILGLVDHPISEPEAAGQRVVVPENALVDRMRGGLTVTPVEGTRLVNISYSSHDPELAAQIVNTLAEEAGAFYLESQYNTHTQATDFLQNQLREMQEKVEETEEELVRYGRQNSLFNLEDARDLVNRKLELLTQELTKTEAEIIAKSAQQEAIDSATFSNFPQMLKTPTINNLEQRLFELKQKLGNLSAQFGPEWPDIIQLKQEIEQVEEHLVAAKTQAIRQARLDWEGMQRSRKQLIEALRDVQFQSEDLNVKSIQYSILKRHSDTNKEIYNALLQRVKEAGVTVGLKKSNITLVDYGRVAEIPYFPNTSRNVMLGLGLGFILGIGLALILEQMDNTVKNPEDVERHLGLASLGTVPQFAAPKKRLQLPEKTGAMDAMILSTEQDPRSKMWEAYRSLRTSLLLSHSGKPPQVILVTSSMPGEGKTTSVANLAIVLAQTGARTLMIDLDMRKPQLGKRFGLNGVDGMSSFLSGNTELTPHIRPTSVPNVFILPSGPIPPNPSELIGSKRMQNAVKLLQDYFQYIIIDSPPVLSVTDALVTVPMADGVVLVIQGGRTPREAVKKSSAQIAVVGGKILGAMINKVEVKKSRYGYYSYYYRYDSSYHYDTYYGED